MLLTPCTLSGAAVRLEPLTLEQLPELTRVALSVQEIFTHFALPMRSAAEIRDTVEQGLARQRLGEVVLLSTRLAPQGELIGGTSLRAVDRSVPSVEIGGTWIVPRWQRTHVN